MALPHISNLTTKTGYISHNLTASRSHNIGGACGFECALTSAFACAEF